ARFLIERSRRVEAVPRTGDGTEKCVSTDQHQHLAHAARRDHRFLRREQRAVALLGIAGVDDCKTLCNRSTPPTHVVHALLYLLSPPSGSSLSYMDQFFIALHIRLCRSLRLKLFLYRSKGHIFQEEGGRKSNQGKDQNSDKAVLEGSG